MFESPVEEPSCKDEGFAKKSSKPGSSHHRRIIEKVEGPKDIAYKCCVFDTFNQHGTHHEYQLWLHIITQIKKS